MICTRCEGTGFLNVDQIPEEISMDLTEATFEYLGKEIGYKKVGNPDWNDLVLEWMEKTEDDHDVSICDCCGDTEGWFGTPGEHEMSDFGNQGPYAYNGGLPECN